MDVEEELVNHVPIVKVLVYSQKFYMFPEIGFQRTPPETIKQTVDIGILDPNTTSMKPNWRTMSITKLGVFTREGHEPDKYFSWDVLEVDNWQKEFPDGLVNHRMIYAKKTEAPDSYEHYHGTFFEPDDEYGCFMKTPRRGFSVREGDTFFINYLGPPFAWTPSNHNEWPKEFRDAAETLMEAFWVLKIGNRRHILSMILPRVGHTYHI